MGKEPGYPAKIHRPIFRKVLQRKRLFSLLDGEENDQLIWVSGIPGSGKTTLVSSYIDHRESPYIWYQLDRGDEDPATFFHYLKLCLEKHSPKQDLSLPPYPATYCPDLTAFTHRFFEFFFSKLKPDSLLVFDSYPDMPDPFIEHVIPDALSRIPQRMKVVVIARRMPPPSFSVVRVHKNLREIRSEDLRLDPDEFRDAVQLFGVRGLNEETLTRLYRVLEGWISGLMLVAASVRRKKFDPVRALGTDIQEIYDFFAGEIEKSLPVETKDFLLKTALMPDMTVETARSLTGCDQAEEILNYLSSHNFFVSRREQYPVVYQYHSLFKEYLQKRAGSLLLPEQVEALQKQTAHLLWKADRIDHAVTMLSRIGEWEDLTGIILARAREMAEQGRYKSLEALISHIPEERQRQNHRILYWKGICRLSFDPGKSRSYFIQSLQLAREAGDAGKSYLSWAGLVQSIVYEFNDLHELDSLIDQFKELRARFPEYPSKEIEAMVVSCMLTALTFRQIEHPEITDWADRNLTLTNEHGRCENRIMAGLADAMLHFYRGNMIDMRVSVESRVEPFAKQEITPHMQPLVHYLVALKEWTKGDMERSLEMIHGGLEIADYTGVHLWDYMLLGQGVISCLCSGDSLLAATHLGLMKDRLPGASNQDRSHFHYLAGWEAALRGDLHLAMSHTEKALNLKKQVGNPFGIASNSLAMAEVLADREDWERAHEILARSREIACQTGSDHLQYLCDLLEARIALDIRDEDKAAAILRRAFTIGESNGIISFFWQRAQHLSRLCSFALKRDIHVRYAQSLVNNHHLVPPDPLMEANNWPWPVRIYTLGRFELIVMGKKVEFQRKAQEKPMDLLKAVLAHSGRKVASDSLVEALWPDSDGATGQQVLATTLHRLRNLIGVKDAIIFSQGKVTLNPELCWVDLWVVERAMGQISPHLQNGSYTGKECGEMSPQVEKALEFYRGHFMSDDGNAPWTIGPRERLRSKYIRTLRNYCQHLERKGEDERAAHWYLKALEQEYLVEELYEGLIQCYLRLGRKAEAMAAYKRCSDTLSQVLGVTPSKTTETLRERILEYGRDQ